MGVSDVCSASNTFSVDGTANDVMLSVDLKECIEKIIESEDYTTYQCKIIPITTDGGSYVGDLYEVFIKGKTAKGNKETNLFIKKILENDELLKVMSMKEMYRREIFAYSELSKILTDLQAEANVPDNERYKMIKSYDSGNSIAIILENMNRKGYKSFNRLNFASLQYAEMAVKELAKFHSLSFVMQKRRPDFYETKVKSIKYGFDFTKHFKDFVENIYDKTIDKLKSDQSKDKVKEYAKNVMVKYNKFFDETHLQTRVLSHGDYRPNNILMKEKDGVVTTLLPVDYQLLHYGNPLHDFFYFIALSSDHKLRLHINDLKNVYYDSLKTFLLYFDIDAEDVYPRKSFEFDFKDRFEYGLMIGIEFLPFILPNDDEVPDIGKDDMSTLTLPTNVEYIERLNELVDDYIKWGYL